MWRLAKKCCDNGLLVAHRVRRNLSNVVALKVELFLSHGSILSHRLRLLFFRQRLSYGKLSSAKKEWFLGRHSDEKWQNMIAADGKLMAATCSWLLTLHVLVSASLWVKGRDYFKYSPWSDTQSRYWVCNFKLMPLLLAFPSPPQFVPCCKYFTAIVREVLNQV